LISQAQAIKSEMTAVEAKVNRSVALLRSLSDERSRWQATSNAFQAQMGTIVGDVMLSSAFLAYAGTYCYPVLHSSRRYLCQICVFTGVEWGWGGGREGGRGGGG
jgi:hypothetical protein